METIKHSEWMEAVRMAARFSKKSALEISRRAGESVIKANYEEGNFLVVTPNWKNMIRRFA